MNYEDTDYKGSPRKRGLVSQMLVIMREIARYAGFDIVATIERGGTAKHPQLSESDKQKCRKAMGRIRKR